MRRARALAGGLLNGVGVLNYSPTRKAAAAAAAASFRSCVHRQRHQ